jgi:hypothetical protein
MSGKHQDGFAETEDSYIYYDESADRFVVPGGNFAGDWELERGFDWSLPCEDDGQMIYNLLYMMRDGESPGPAYDLACDLYSSFREYRTENNIF